MPLLQSVGVDEKLMINMALVLWETNASQNIYHPCKYDVRLKINCTASNQS